MDVIECDSWPINQVAPAKIPVAVLELDLNQNPTADDLEEVIIDPQQNGPTHEMFLDLNETQVNEQEEEEEEAQ